MLMPLIQYRNLSGCGTLALIALVARARLRNLTGCDTNFSGTICRAGRNQHRPPDSAAVILRPPKKKPRRLSMTGTTDYELLQRMKTGDEEAFVALYRRRQGNVYRFALRMCGSESIAEDVTQEVFMVLMREAEKFDARRAQLTTWLIGIARNQVLKQLERERRWVSLTNAGNDDDEARDFVFQGADPLAAFAHKLTVEKVRQAVLTLPPHYREVVVLCEFQEMSYAETADVLGCAIGTVRSRLHRGKAILCGLLGESPRAAQETPAVSQKAETQNLASLRVVKTI